jgi:nucleoside 2-deoxyribosyltransferase
MKIMVCGSIGYGGVDEIKEFYSFLEKEGFEILNHIISKGMDYSDIKDFRDQKELSARIVEHDLGFVNKADIILVLANKASYGTAIEMFVAKQSGKKVILLAKNPIPTPWPIYYSDSIVSSEEALITLLRQINSKAKLSESL